MQGMKSLHVFGHNPIQHHSEQEDPQHEHAPMLQAQSISILWASWCDIIVAHSDSTHLVYHGTSLTAAQIGHIAKLPYDPSPDTEGPIFFGRVLDHGVMGFVDPKARDLSVFASHGAAKRISSKTNAVVETISYRDANFDIVDIRFTSGDCAFVSLKLHWGQDGTMKASDMETVVLQFPSLQDFLGILRSEPQLLEHQHQVDRSPSDSSHLPRVLTSSSPLQLCTNATTLTALSPLSGQIYTFAPDPRFPKCLGRYASAAEAAESIPYFSEVGLSKTASGGYYTCAISASPSPDSFEGEVGGELYIWGQAPPGTNQELFVLKNTSSPEDLDDFVRCVELEIDGIAGQVTDVAIGWGHVLVTVEASQRGKKNEVSRAVFAAGCNKRKQLGLEGEMLNRNFVEEFTEMGRFKDKKIVQIKCSGWSSYVVVEENE